MTLVELFSFYSLDCKSRKRFNLIIRINFQIFSHSHNRCMILSSKCVENHSTYASLVFSINKICSHIQYIFFSCAVAFCAFKHCSLMDALLVYIGTILMSYLPITFSTSKLQLKFVDFEMVVLCEICGNVFGKSPGRTCVQIFINFSSG